MRVFNKKFLGFLPSCLLCDKVVFLGWFFGFRGGFSYGFKEGLESSCELMYFFSPFLVIFLCWSSFVSLLLLFINFWNIFIIIYYKRISYLKTLNPVNTRPISLENDNTFNGRQICNIATTTLFSVFFVSFFFSFYKRKVRSKF